MSSTGSAGTLLVNHPAPDSIGGRRGVWAVLMALGWLFWSGPVAAQFSVYPAMVELDAQAGPAVQTVTVENQGEDAIEVGIYINDYDRAMDGGHSYVEFGEHPNTCRGRLEAFPDQLAVEPGERGEIRLRMEAGPGACWGVVFVERRTLTASGITMAQRIGVKVLARTSGAALEGRVVSLVVDSAGERAARILFENEGDGWLDVEGEIEIRGMTGDILEVVEVEGFRVLPRRSREVRVALADLGLEPGQYVLVAILDFGGDYLAGAQALLEVDP